MHKNEGEYTVCQFIVSLMKFWQVYILLFSPNNFKNDMWATIECMGQKFAFQLGNKPVDIYFIV